ncbi:uncharacterized protein LOC143148168 isoform X1 [Ptiloglossa arizonensis]|uniref:uncharacterized protein LOC143148168 isoform X1 n=1 Tax=Ptiloglossa arizonensis TaxID=3350558 RepID=UPI003F9EBC74
MTPGTNWVAYIDSHGSRLLVFCSRSLCGRYRVSPAGDRESKIVCNASGEELHTCSSLDDFRTSSVALHRFGIVFILSRDIGVPLYLASHGPVTFLSVLIVLRNWKFARRWNKQVGSQELYFKRARGRSILRLPLH